MQAVLNGDHARRLLQLSAGSAGAQLTTRACAWLQRTVEGEEPVNDPTLKEIFTAIDSLTAKEGPGETIVTSRATNSTQPASPMPIIQPIIDPMPPFVLPAPPTGREALNRQVHQAFPGPISTLPARLAVRVEM